MPTDIHVICQRQLNWKQIDDGARFETGNWVIAEATAAEARDTGGSIYLHEHQAWPSWHGGKLIDFKKSPKVRFTYSTDDGSIAVPSPGGWNQRGWVIHRQNLHLICPCPSRWKHTGDRKFFTGNWDIPPNEAQGAERIYLHENRNRSSWHGGKIETRDEDPKQRFIFIYDASPIAVTCSEGWAIERAIVRHSSRR